MALLTKQISVTNAAQSLTTLLGLSTGRHFYAFHIIGAEGATGVIYGGMDDTVTAVPANAGFKATASLGYGSPSLPFQSGHTDHIYMIATVNPTVAHVMLWE